MTISNALSLILGIAALLAFDLRADDGFRFELSPQQIRPGERARLLVRVPFTPTENGIDPKIYDELITQSTELIVLEKEIVQEKNELTIRFEITTHHSGTFILPPLQIQVGPNSYSTESLTLEVLAVREAGDSELRPEFGPVDYPKPWKRWAAFFLGSLALFYGASLLLKKIKIQRKKRRVVAKPIPEENPLVWLRRELDRFAAELTPQDQLPSAKSDELLALVRTYFEKVSKNPVRAWTLSEFQERLAKDPAAKEIAQRLALWLPLHYVPAPKPEPLKAATEEVEKVLLP